MAGNINAIAAKYMNLSHAGALNQNMALSFAATEIERLLYPRILPDLIADYFYNTISPQVKYVGAIDSARFQSQVYIACRRSFLDDDEETLRYVMLGKYVPEVLPHQVSNEELVPLAPRVAKAIALIDTELDNPLAWRIAVKLRNHSIFVSVIDEIVRQYSVVSEEIFNDPVRFEETVRQILAEKYKLERSRVNKSGTRAIIYIFMTKVVLGLTFEFPYEIFFFQSLNYLALGTNVFFHPLLLFAMIKSVRVPDEENTKRIVTGIQHMIHGESTKDIYIRERVHHLPLQIIFGFFYLLLYAISFGFLLSVLKFLEFNFVSIVLFLLFLTLVSYFGIRIRHKAKKWLVDREHEGFGVVIWNFLTLPIVRAGGWINRKFSRINFAVFVLDFIIETPFKFTLGAFDSFVSFINEKREGPY